MKKTKKTNKKTPNIFKSIAAYRVRLLACDHYDGVSKNPINKKYGLVEGSIWIADLVDNGAFLRYQNDQAINIPLHTFVLLERLE